MVAFLSGFGQLNEFDMWTFYNFFNAEIFQSPKYNLIYMIYIKLLMEKFPPIFSKFLVGILYI
tara:strand:+ start:64346 stop:64534 length:189 start_codon:yes stop_codon:yes gene_type:complete